MPVRSHKLKNRLHEAPAAPKQLLSPLLFWIGAATLLAAVFLVYAPSLNYPFILDDSRFIGDRRVQLPGQIFNYFRNAAWAQFAGGPVSFYRPLFVVWIRANYILNEMSPWGWHFASILKHLSVAGLLGVLVWKLLRDRMAVLLAVALFAFHPSHTESVAWISVPDPLMSAAILGSLLLHRKHRDTAWLPGAALFYLAALLVKETALVALPIFFALELSRPAELRRRGSALRAMPLFLAATAVYFVLRLHALGSRILVFTQHLSWQTLVLSWPATLWFYVKVLFWPFSFRAFGNPTETNSFSVDGVVLPALGLCGVACVLSFAIRWAWAKAHGASPDRRAGVECALLMGVLLLSLPLVPALNLDGLNPGDYLHGRYAYLSLTGLSLLAAAAWSLTANWRMPLLGAAAAVVALFAVLTVAQEPAWLSERAVFTAGHQAAPRNTFVDRNLVRTYVQEAFAWDIAGRCREALPVFEGATRRYPDDWYGWAGLGDCFYQLDDLPRAEQALHRAVELSHQSQVTERWEEVKEKLDSRKPGT